MIQLSQETEALALRIAAAQRLPVDAAIQRALEAIRESLEAQAHGLAVASQGAPQRDLSPEAVAARVARFDALARKIEAAPINDVRPVAELVNELNAL